MSANKPEGTKADHGYRNEVSWDNGRGRQPYANQGDKEEGPATAGEFEAGNRGDQSGRNADQMDQARGTPD
jgi:hypothetical protein